jgi:predicted RNA-binding protein YlxR (DUF448 family)
VSAAKTGARPKHVPQRSCVGCGTSAAKRTLVRLVRTASAAVEPDPTGKAAGRGAYLCAQAACWESALKKGRLAKALQVDLSRANRDALLEHGGRLAGVTA